MMDVIINGGTLRSDNDHEVVANVEYVLQKAGEKEWRIYLKGLPAKRNFLKGEKLVYNPKGTNNVNADNDMIVKEVLGPAAYLCSGPQKMNC
jgi:hypothetical protein